jgi:hypothetical protein
MITLFHKPKSRSTRFIFLLGIAAVPGGGLWAVGVTSGNSNFSTLIMYHP